MKRTRLTLLLVAMVLLPVAGAGTLGLRIVLDEERLLEHQVQEMLRGRLREVDDSIRRFMDQTGLRLRRAAEGLPADVPGIRRESRRRPGLGALLVTDRRGKILFPPPDGPLSEAETSFLDHTRVVWDGGVLPTLARDAGFGWHGWYHDEGLNLLFWIREESRIVAIEVPRIELLSALVGILPDTDPDGAGAGGRTALLDSGGEVVYQWGGHDPGRAQPSASVPLSPPLGAWRLVHWPRSSPVAAGTSRLFAVAVGLAALAAVLIGLAVYVYRERTREMRLASQRVSFVNQVSHELRTPLTNIRLYAELAEAEVDPDADPRLAHRLQVIGTEARRLSRLIRNVLTLARDDPKASAALRPTAAVVDEVVEDILSTFEASFVAASIDVDLSLGTPDRVLVDPDALEQILSNLLGNVEKYAASGKYLGIRTERAGEMTAVRVTDRGPGIPRAYRERVFEPYFRLRDDLNEGVTGTGIGLDIARRLARLHGGDLHVQDGETGGGACFVLTLRTPPAPPGPETEVDG